MNDETREHRSALAKTIITIGGFLVLLAGVAMLVLPGPGLVTMGAGLAILALEYDWAKRLLHRVRERIRAAAERAKELKR